MKRPSLRSPRNAERRIRTRPHSRPFPIWTPVSHLAPRTDTIHQWPRINRKRVHFTLESSVDRGEPERWGQGPLARQEGGGAGPESHKSEGGSENGAGFPMLWPLRDTPTPVLWVAGVSSSSSQGCPKSEALPDGTGLTDPACCSHTHWPSKTPHRHRLAHVDTGLPGPRHMAGAGQQQEALASPNGLWLSYTSVLLGLELQAGRACWGSGPRPSLQLPTSPAPQPASLRPICFRTAFSPGASGTSPPGPCSLQTEGHQARTRLR